MENQVVTSNNQEIFHNDYQYETSTSDSNKYTGNLKQEILYYKDYNGANKQIKKEYNYTLGNLMVH